MDYEKLYKETINKLRKLHDDWNSTQNRAAKELELVLPELHGLSETEMIENLHRLLSAEVSIGTFEKYGLTDDAVFSWLEKQGEQKPTEWNEEDEKMISDLIDLLNGGKTIIPTKTYINWLKTLKDRIQPQPKQEWSEEDEEILNNIITAFKRIGENCEHYFSPDTAKVFEKTLKSLKNRIALQHKSEWSEDDERAINDIIVAVSMYANGEIPYTLPSQLLKDVERLKSLKPQKHWKPSEGSQVRNNLKHCGILFRILQILKRILILLQNFLHFTKN